MSTLVLLPLDGTNDILDGIEDYFGADALTGKTPLFFLLNKNIEEALFVSDGPIREDDAERLNWLNMRSMTTT